jgi:hypothetical protein
VRTGAFSAPRPHPRLLLPAAAGALVITVALPVFIAAGWPFEAWLLGAALWAGAQALGLLLGRFKTGADNLAASGVVGIGMSFRAVAVGVVLIAVAASDGTLALAAGLLYALAYTLELALSLMTYFGQEPV